MDSQQVTPVDSIKVPEFDKHLKKARGHHWPKRYGNNNKNEDNSPKTLNDKNIVLVSKTSFYLDLSKEAFCFKAFFTF